MTSIPLRRIEGKYEILEKLGEGGMGAVYKVRHRLLDAVRVIKMMRPQLIEDEGLKARFLREARVATQLRHPNIAQLYDFTIDEGVASIVMEYVPGVTLESVVRSGVRPSLGLTLEISQQTLRALAYLHGKGFVHRDISPDNLMLAEGADGEPQVKLIDLGIAKTLGAGATGYRTQTGTFLGKLRYSPPEQFGAGGASAVDERGDLYSFGLVLYELLTGQYPIRGRDPSALIAGHLFWPPLAFAESDPQGAVPPELRATVLRTLAKKPEERFASARELGQALSAFRSPPDLPAGELQRVLRRAALGAVEPPAHDPGSTQNRLDYQFGLRTTPQPPLLVEVKPAPPPPVDAAARRREIAAAVERFEALLGRGDFHAAELLLLDAEVEHGEQEIFPALHGRLAESRRRDREARALARRRAAAIAAAVQEIESRLTAGDAERAAEALAAAVAAHGEGAVPDELRERVLERRREAREAERRREGEGRRAALAAAAAGIAARLDAGDLAAAEGGLGEALAAFGEEKPLKALRSRLAAARRRLEEARLREEETRRLAEEARRLEEEARQREEEARRSLEEARLREEEEARRREDEEAQRREEETRRRLEEARRLAEEARLRAEEEARRLAAEARRREEAEARRRKDLEEAAAALAAKLAALLASARRRLAGGELDRLLAELDAVEALDAGNAAARELREAARIERERREEEARREVQRAAALAAIDTLLEKGDLRGATELLPAAVAEFGEDTLVRNRRQRVEELGRRAEEARERELAGSLAAIDGCLAEGRLEEAARLLPAAVATFGGTPALRQRWERLEALHREAAARMARARDRR